MKVFLSSLILLLSIWGASDPIKVGMRDVLASVSQDEQWRLSQQTLSWLNQQNYRSPLLQKLEIRLGSNDLLLTRQQYGIRVSPGVWGQGRSQQQLQQAQGGVLQLEAQAAWNEALLARYEAIATYHFATQLQRATRQLDSLLLAQEDVFRTMLRQGIRVDLKDVVDNEQDRQDVALDQRQYEHAKQTAATRIQQFLSAQSEVELDVQTFIDVRQIERVVAASALPLALLDNQLREAQKNVVQSELNLLKVRNREYISFFQFGYERTPRTPSLDDDLFLRMGVNIPLNNTNRLKNNELLFKMQELDTKNQLALTQHQQETDLQRLKVNQLLQEYTLRETQINKNLALTILNDPELRNEVTPADLLSLQVLRQKKHLSQLKLAQDLTQQYLQLLFLQGKLVERPLLNYLSNTLEPW